MPVAIEVAQPIVEARVVRVAPDGKKHYKRSAVAEAWAVRVRSHMLRYSLFILTVTTAQTHSVSATDTTYTFPHHLHTYMLANAPWSLGAGCDSCPPPRCVVSYHGE